MMEFQLALGKEPSNNFETDYPEIAIVAPFVFILYFCHIYFHHMFKFFIKLISKYYKL
jgi:hypothetical protein